MMSGGIMDQLELMEEFVRETKGSGVGMIIMGSFKAENRSDMSGERRMEIANVAWTGKYGR